MSKPVFEEKGNATFSLGDSTIQYRVEEGVVYIDSLRTKTKGLKQGQARACMEVFLSAVDEQRLSCELIASPLNKQTKLGKLVRFYESFGFEFLGKFGNAAFEPILCRPTNELEAALLLKKDDAKTPTNYGIKHS